MMHFEAMKKRRKRLLSGWRHVHCGELTAPRSVKLQKDVIAAIYHLAEVLKEKNKTKETSAIAKHG